LGGSLSHTTTLRHLDVATLENFWRRVRQRAWKVFGTGDVFRLVCYTFYSLAKRRKFIINLEDIGYINLFFTWSLADQASPVGSDHPHQP
jgi:hypothetical protein